jgi:hypothetical protein
VDSAAIGYLELREKVQKAFAICDSIGLDPRKGRFGDYARRLDQVIDVVSARRDGQPRESLEQRVTDDGVAYMLALVESTEFADVVIELAACDPDAFKNKLKTVLSGPFTPIEENSSSGNRPRNTLFELNLAAKLQRSGFPPIFGEHPDVATMVGRRKVCFECKRPFSARKIRDNLEAAAVQLVRDLRDYRINPVNSRGVVAISLSKTLNPGDLLYVYDDHIAAEAQLAKLLRDIAETHKSIHIKLNTNIIGVMYHVITPGVNRTLNRYDVAQELLIVPLERAGHDGVATLRTLAHALGAEE